MDKYKYVILVLLLTSCVGEYKVSNGENYAELQCLKPKRDMYLYSVYDLCPLFYRKPKRENQFWHLVDINADATKHLDANNSNEYRVLKNVRDCSWPSRVSVVRFIKKGEHLKVKKIVRRSDSASDQGLSFYGDVKVNENIYMFEADILKGYGKNVVDRIYMDFDKCVLN